MLVTGRGEGIWDDQILPLLAQNLSCFLFYFLYRFCEELVTGSVGAGL